MDKNDVIMTAWLFESICKSNEGLIYQKGAEVDIKGGAVAASGGYSVEHGAAVVLGDCSAQHGVVGVADCFS